MSFFVYIMASQRNGTLYVGYTDSIGRRLIEHEEGSRPGSFTHRYGVTRLVYFEMHEGRTLAWARERAVKRWRRKWKLELIERFNPGWEDIRDRIPPG